MYGVGFTSPHHPPSEALRVLFSGLLLALGIVRLAVPENKDRNLAQQRFRHPGSLRVSHFSCGKRMLSLTPA